MPTWNEIALVEVPARPAVLWTMACEWVEGPGPLKIEVVAPGETWNYGRDASCTADGDLVSELDARRCPLATAPVGALIGRIGGSTADPTGAFPVGRLCIVELREEKPGTKALRGPLFLAINDILTGYADNSRALHVRVWQAQSEPAATTAAVQPSASGAATPRT